MENTKRLVWCETGNHVPMVPIVRVGLFGELIQMCPNGDATNVYEDGIRGVPLLQQELAQEGEYMCMEHSESCTFKDLTEAEYSASISEQDQALAIEWDDL